VVLQSVWAAKAGTLNMTPRIDQETRAYAITPE
jgi:peptide/nickel transport system substrate-binding protein